LSSSLGVDLGATWLRASLAVDGKIVRRWKRPAVKWTVLAAELKKMKPGRLDRLTVGPTGVWHAAQRAALKKSLGRLAAKVRVISDVELAHEAAFGGGPGILALAGTGSICLGKNARGKAARAGGLGALLGDEGSGFWLGREALREPKLAKFFPESLALRLAHDPKPIRAIAALAPRVLALAKRNAAARAIVARGAFVLAGQAEGLARKLGMRSPVPVCCHGSVFKDAVFKKAFKRRLGRGFVESKPSMPAADAAAIGFSA
jgi:N-acetylglucosamine kinase-like BadF-type ATPase